MNKPARTSTGSVDAFLGARIREQRQSFELTQEQLAASMARIGHSTWQAATVAAIETGRRNISLDELRGLCGLFDVSLNQLAHTGGIGTIEADVMVGPMATDRKAQLPSTDLIFDPEKFDPLGGPRKLKRLERAILSKAITAYETSPRLRLTIERAVLPTLREHYGHDLLAERDARIEAEGLSRTWASRQLSEEVQQLPVIQAFNEYDADQWWALEQKGV